MSLTNALWWQGGYGGAPQTICTQYKYCWSGGRSGRGGGQAERWYNDSRDISFDSWLNNLVFQNANGHTDQNAVRNGAQRGRGEGEGRWGEQEVSKLDGIGTD